MTPDKLFKVKLTLMQRVFPSELIPAYRYVLTGGEEWFERFSAKRLEKKITDPYPPICDERVLGRFEEFLSWGLERDEALRLLLVINLPPFLVLPYYEFLQFDDISSLQRVNEPFVKHQKDGELKTTCSRTP